MIASFVEDFTVLNFMQKNEHINLSAKIVRISDHIKLTGKMNNNDQIPLITGLAIDDIIWRKTFFNIAPGELIKTLGLVNDFSSVLSILVKKDYNWFLIMLLLLIIPNKEIRSSKPISVAGKKWVNAWKFIAPKWAVMGAMVGESVFPSLLAWVKV